MEIKTDVLICTYNSGKYLDECLNYVMKNVPINRILIADHNSSDNTLDIAKKYNAVVFNEKIGLAAARNLLMEKSETDIITWIDSDLIVKETGWWNMAYKLLMSSYNIAVVVARVNEADLLTPRMKYTNWWFTKIPSTRKFALTLGSTLMRRKDIMHIPESLNASEDTYMSIIFKQQNRRWENIYVYGTHYFDYNENKCYWGGANMRILGKIVKVNRSYNNIILLFLRRVLPSVLKAVPPAIYYKDFSIIRWNMSHWVKFLIGWMNPESYTRMNRKYDKVI